MYLCIYVYMYIYMYVYVCVCVCLYIIIVNIHIYISLRRLSDRLECAAADPAKAAEARQRLVKLLQVLTRVLKGY